MLKPPSAKLIPVLHSFCFHQGLLCVYTAFWFAVTFFLAWLPLHVQAAPLPGAVLHPAAIMPAADVSSLPVEVDTPEYWLADFNELNAIYQSYWPLPPDGLHEDYPRSDGANIAWIDTRYAMAAYLDLYHWSKDTMYLDWLVEDCATLVL